MNGKDRKKEVRWHGHSFVSLFFSLLFVMLGTATYLFLSHMLFPDIAFLESHIATVVLDSFVATIVAFLVLWRFNRLSEKRLIEQLRADEAERSAREYTRSLIEASLDPLVTISADGRIRDVNAATEMVTGFSRGELVDTDFSSYFTDPQRARDVYEKVLEHGSIRDFELTIRHRNGHLSPVLYNASVYMDNEKQVKGVFAAARDVTHYRKAQQELERRNQELIAINTIARTVSQSLDLKEMLDNAINELLKLSFFRGEAGGMIFLSNNHTSDLSALVHRGIPSDHPCLSSPVKRGECLCGLAFSSEDLIISHEKGSDERHTRRCHGDGQRADVCVPLRARSTVVGILYLTLPEAFREMTDSGVDFLVSIGGQIGIAIDNVLLYEKVRDQHNHLRKLIHRLGEVEESERRELARELHDKVGQNLTAMGISLNILKAQLSQNTPEFIQSRIDDCLDLVSETTSRIRDVMAELRPSVLDDYGLFSALRWYGAQFSLRTGIEVNLEGDENMKRLRISTENTFFRIAQEALINIAKHAGASRVTIHLNTNDGHCRMEISDNGRGFNHDVSLQTVADNKWGLSVMHERALRIGGRFQILSQIGEGTRVIVEVDQ